MDAHELPGGDGYHRKWEPNIRAATLMVLISAWAPLLFCVCVCVFLFHCCFVPSSDSPHRISSFSSGHLSWGRKRREKHVLKLWRRSGGINQQSMYDRNRPDVVSNIHRTLMCNWSQLFALENNFLNSSGDLQREWRSDWLLLSNAASAGRSAAHIRTSCDCVRVFWQQTRSLMERPIGVRPVTASQHTTDVWGVFSSKTSPIIYWQKTVNGRVLWGQCPLISEQWLTGSWKNARLCDSEIKGV